MGVSQYVKFKWSSSMISTWSSNFHWTSRPGGDFMWFWDYSKSDWVSVNGHTNNWHFSNYNARQRFSAEHLF